VEPQVQLAFREQVELQEAPVYQELRARRVLRVFRELRALQEALESLEPRAQVEQLEFKVLLASQDLLV
jgi:hypothetical protein